MTPPWVRLTRPFCWRISTSRRTVELETLSSRARVSRSLMPRRASNSWRRDWRSAISIFDFEVSFGAVGTACDVGGNARTGIGNFLRGGHFFEVGGAVGFEWWGDGSGDDGAGGDWRGLCGFCV